VKTKEARLLERLQKDLMVRFTICLPESIDERLTDYAEAVERSRLEVIRAILDDYLPD